MLADRFEANRTHLRAVAYRMLGSVSEADDAVQEAWLRLNRSDATAVREPRRLADDRGRAGLPGHAALAHVAPRGAARPDVPEPIVDREDGADPEHEALLADSVGLAMLVVLETLSPAERLAFVLHDMFARPVRRDRADRRPLAGRSAPAREPRAAPGARLGARARSRPGRQREVVDAFLAAARDGDFDALVAVLDPDVVLRVDRGASPASEVRGAEQPSRSRRWRFARLAGSARPALVNGAAGFRRGPQGAAASRSPGFTVADGRIVEIDLLADPERLRELDLAFLDG